MGSQAVLQMPRLRVVAPDEVSPAVARARAERSARRTLLVLTASVAVLTLGGLVMVLSASSVSAFTRYGSSFLFFKRQALFAAVGLVAAVGTSRIPHRAWQRAWLPLMAVTVVLLLMVLHPTTGTVAGGSARWITLGP